MSVLNLVNVLRNLPFRNLGLKMFLMFTVLSCLAVHDLVMADENVSKYKILYSRPGSGGIYMMDTDGSNEQQIVDFGGGVAVSNDNKRIAFNEGYNHGIWIANIDGSGRLKLTDFGAFPSWSPDGSRIVFFDSTSEGTGRKLWIMNADGSELHKLSDTVASFPKWSHFGTEIIFNSNGNIGIIKSDGSGERILNSGVMPVFTPDDKNIVYSLGRDLWIMDTDGKNRLRLFSGGMLSFDISGDSTMIVFWIKKDGIYIMSSDGNNRRKLCANGWYPVFVELPENNL